MRTSLSCALLVAVSVLGSGCRTYVYRVVQPPQVATAVVGEQAVIIHYDPIDYRLQRYRDRLLLRITNPTDERLVLQANRSYLIDPQGESHPLRGRIIGPHSYTTLLLPPWPVTAGMVGGYGYYGPGWGWGPAWGWGWGPAWGWGWGPGVYDGFYGPPMTYYQVATPYDWEWKQGPVRLHLSYERDSKTFEHNLEFVREQKK